MQERETNLFLAGDLPTSSCTAPNLELRPLFWDSWWMRLTQRKTQNTSFNDLNTQPLSSLSQRPMKIWFRISKNTHMQRLQCTRALESIHSELVHNTLEKDSTVTHFFLIPIGVFLCEGKKKRNFFLNTYGHISGKLICQGKLRLGERIST